MRIRSLPKPLRLDYSKLWGEVRVPKRYPSARQLDARNPASLSNLESSHNRDSLGRALDAGMRGRVQKNADKLSLSVRNDKPPLTT